MLQVKIFRSISAVFLSLLVLISTSSFAMNMHLCMGEVENLAFFSPAEPCELSVDDMACHNEIPEPIDHLVNTGCCDDREILIEGQDELEVTGAASTYDLQLAAILYAVVLRPWVPAAANTDSFVKYTPPLIERDIPVLVQSFLL